MTRPVASNQPSVVLKGRQRPESRSETELLTTGIDPQPGASLATKHRNVQAGMPLPDVMRLGGWRDLASVQRYMGLLNHDRLTAAVEAAWA